MLNEKGMERFVRLMARAESFFEREDARISQVAAGTHVRIVREGRGGESGSDLVWRKPKKERPRCGAKCRTGKPCRAPVYIQENGQAAKRCRMHGGLSTGPKTEEGRARIAESNRRRAVQRSKE